MPVKDVVYYSNGAKLLIFCTGKTKYFPSTNYITAKNNLTKPFIRRPNLHEVCDRFFTKIFEEAKKRYNPKLTIKDVDYHCSGKNKKK